MLSFLYGLLHVIAVGSFNVLAWFANPIGEKRKVLDRRDELAEARDEIHRQVEILALGPVNYKDVTPQRERLLTDLRHALDEL